MRAVLDVESTAVVEERVVQQGKRVLVVDDNPVNQKVAARLVEKLGHHVDLAANGQEAVDAARAGAYDLVLMDCQMPVLDGYQATAEIRKLQAANGRVFPIIAITANAMVGDREKCIAAGMDDYLPKPVSGDDMGKILNRWLQTAPAVSPAAPAKTITGDPTLIDHAILDTLRDSEDNSLLRDVIDMFVNDSPKQIEAINQALAAGALEQLGRVAHRMKGSSLALGLRPLSELCARIEAACKAGSRSDTEALLSGLSDLYQRSRDALAALRPS